MLIKSARVENFASYKQLDIDFSDKGLMLIHGSTGSGKSTICDIIPWILFGRTAKGGNADEILSWPGDQITQGEIAIGDLTIIRTRGPKAKDNDLCYTEVKDGFESLTRGKDLNDTQKLINEILGVNYELYLSGAYYHEFSQTAQFFNTTAKNRRAILEQIVDLSLATRLQTNLSEAKKANKLELTKLDPAIVMTTTNIQNNLAAIKRETNRSEVWEIAHQIHVKELDEKNNNFESNKALRELSLTHQLHDWNIFQNKTIADLEDKIGDLKRQVKPIEFYSQWQKRIGRAVAKHRPSTCKTCGADKEHQLISDLRLEQSDLLSEQASNDVKWSNITDLTQRLQQAKGSENPYSVPLEMNSDAKNTYVDQLDKELARVNPHRVSIEYHQTELKALNIKKAELDKQSNELKQTQSDLELLSEITDNFRGEVIKNTISDIEHKTNELLAQHFDSEVQISLSVEGSDKVEAIISKDGNIAAYSQLSKGQRQLLKLCFGVSVMKVVQNHHNVDFQQIFLDEALDGLDEHFKLKAYGLLQSLALHYNSVFVVEHSSELKAQFENQIYVELTSEGSIVETK